MKEAQYFLVHFDERSNPTRCDPPTTFLITSSGVLVIETEIERRHYAPGQWVSVVEVLET